MLPVSECQRPLTYMSRGLFPSVRRPLAKSSCTVILEACCVVCKCHRLTGSETAPSETSAQRKKPKLEQSSAKESGEAPAVSLPEGSTGSELTDMTTGLLEESGRVGEA